MRKLLVLAIIGVVAAAIVRALRGNPAPQFSTHPSVTGGPNAATREAGPTPSAPPPRAVAATASAPAPAPAPTSLADADHAWVDPIDGSCPDGFPIKAKLSSGIFHAPGGLAYERTKPDRCYADAASAEADGLRPAKR